MDSTALETRPGPSQLTSSRTERTVVLVLACLLGVILLGRLVGQGIQPQTHRIESVAESRLKIDINQARESTLMLLPGIGPSKARAIVNSRKYDGAFTELAELTRVHGIAEGTVNNIRPWIVVDIALDQ